MDGIYISKQGTVDDFKSNIGRVLGSVGKVTQRTFGGSVVLFGFTRAILILGIIAYVERMVASEMRTWPRFFKMRRQRLLALSRHAERPRSYASLKY